MYFNSDPLIARTGYNIFYEIRDNKATNYTDITFIQLNLNIKYTILKAPAL